MKYADSGVDIDAATRALARSREHVRSTWDARVRNEIGAFGGLFQPAPGEPLLVASVDGVGTKVMVAVQAGRYDTVGQDLVNHCVDDILVQGARPLFFMDYFATGGLDPDVVVSVVEGVARGCRTNGCALIGGETAEMPGFYAAGEYDIAGFIVGVVDRQHVITGAGIVPGDVAIALPSVGLHTNGYSLARKLFFEVGRFTPELRPEQLGGASVGEALLAPHKSYLPALDGLLETGQIKGLAHITGGGLVDNVPRVLNRCDAWIDRKAWTPPALFRYLCEKGRVSREEAYQVFNMGIGMVLFVAPSDERAVREHLVAQGERVHVLGRTEPARAAEGAVRWLDA